MPLKLVVVTPEKKVVDIDTDQVELLPTKFYPWQFKVNVEAFNANMPSSGDVTAPGR